MIIEVSITSDEVSYLLGQAERWKDHGYSKAECLDTLRKGLEAAEANETLEDTIGLAQHWSANQIRTVVRQVEAMEPW